VSLSSLKITSRTLFRAVAEHVAVHCAVPFMCINIQQQHANRQ